MNARETVVLADAAVRVVTDDEIVVSAVFVSSKEPNLSGEDRVLAMIAELVHRNAQTPMSFVMWPCGFKALIPITPKSQSGEARRALIKVYRAGEAGGNGPVDVRGQP